jgi:hypothetical protein
MALRKGAAERIEAELAEPLGLLHTGSTVLV